MLLTAKTDVNARRAASNGRAALQATAQGGHLEMVERLLTANGDVSANANCQAALQAAANG